MRRRNLLIVFLATQNAWTATYRGEAPRALWSRIKRATQLEHRYTQYLAIIQSSGTGKSRMIDELSKEHLVIPLNLRGSRETGLSFYVLSCSGLIHALEGYPPPDAEARGYLTVDDNPRRSRVRAAAFLRAVFQVALESVIEIKKSLKMDAFARAQIALSFSRLMSEGMTSDSHGAFRQQFYHQVFSRARQVCWL